MKLQISSSVGLAQPVELEAEAGDTVESLIQKAADIQAVSPDSISLTKDGEIIDRTATLKKAGIKDGDALKAMPKDPIGGATTLSPVARHRIQAEVQRLRDARIPMQFVNPQRVRGRLVGRGRWAKKDLFFDIHLPRDYPARPPLVVFRTALDPPHPNIGPNGHVCLNHLQDSWTPQQNLVTVYEDLLWLLDNPNYADPLHPAYQGRRARRPTRASLVRRILEGQ